MSENMRLRVLLDAIDRATGPMRRVLGGSQALTASLRTQREALRGLNAQQRDVSAFRELADKSKASTAALKDQRAKVRQLAAEMRAAEQPSEELAQKFAAATRTAGRMKYEVSRNAERLQALRTRLADAGISTSQLGTHERRLRTDIVRANEAIEQQQKRLTALNAAQKRSQALQNAGLKATALGAGMAFGGRRALDAAVLPVGEAVGFESAMADVRKVVDFDTPQQFALMGRDIEDLSMRLPMLPAEIAKIVAAAGQASIPRKELLQFAEDATKLGVAFDTTAEDAGQTMATWRTAFRMGQAEVVTLADKINYLGNTGPANVQKISDVVNRIGALGEVAGLQSGPLAALGATVAGVGIESEVSATGIKNMLLTLSSGEAATKRQLAAFDQLGLSATQMAQAMQKDAGGAILDVLERLKKLPAASQAATMTSLFGRESIGAIAPLLTNLDLLKDNFNKVADAQRYAGSMEQEYLSRVATSANAMQLAKNTALVMAATFGRTLLPDIKATSEAVGALLKRVVDWTRNNAPLARALTVSAVAGAALVTVLGGLLTVGGLASMALGQISGAVALLSGGGGIGALIARFGTLAAQVLPTLLNVGRALMVVLGGISWPLLAIAAAVAVVAAVVWKYWGPIKAFMIGVWQGLQDAFAPVLAELRTALAPLVPLWDQVAGAIGKVWEWVKQLFAPFEATTEQLEGATSAGRTFGQFLGTALTLQLRMAVKAIGWLVTAATTMQAVVMRVVGGLAQYLGGAWSVIVGLFTGNGQRITQGLQSMWTGINTLLASWPARMMHAGVDMVMGLVNGIRSKISAATSAVSGVGRGVIDQFKGMLGIHSPSRVFAELGGFTMQGLANGLQAGQNGPLAALQGITRRIQQVGAGAALAALAGPVGAVDTRPPVSASQSAPAAPFGNIEIHIHTQPGQDAGDIARLVRAEFQALQREQQARARSALGDRE
jgi:TP901 family phage tail tape measure protein